MIRIGTLGLDFFFFFLISNNNINIEHNKDLGLTKAIGHCLKKFNYPIIIIYVILTYVPTVQ